MGQRRVVRFAPASQDAAERVAQRLRPSDVDEIQAAHGLGADVGAVVMASVELSDAPMAAWAGDEPIALLGCAPCGTLLGGFGAPWLLGTPACAGFPRVFVGAGRTFVAGWLRRHGRLSNHVDARNLDSVRWLRAIGFDVAAPAPFGAMGMPFHRFSMQ